jgi:hypothetical protein
MPERPPSQILALGLLGAVIGGCLGYFAFGWLIKQGFYALIVPPALMGFAAGQSARERSKPLAVICAVAGFGLGLFLEWKFFPFVVDPSLSYFLTHLHQLRPLTWVMLAIGALVSYSLALRNNPLPTD